MATSNVEIALEFIKALERGDTGEALARFLAPDVIIREMPSRVAPYGSVSDLAKALEGAKRGQQLFKRQTYTVTNILGDGDWVALELDWTGITAVRFQNLPIDSEMRDHAAIFLQFRNGQIASQRIYDCFEPW